MSFEEIDFDEELARSKGESDDFDLDDTSYEVKLSKGEKLDEAKGVASDEDVEVVEISDG